jgi:integrase
MPKRQLPHLQYESTRHGRMVWYVRVDRGPRFRIQGEYGTAEFLAGYRAALEGKKTPMKMSKAPKGCLNWLVDEWRQSSDWASTSLATRRQRENILVHVLRSAGTVPFEEITQKVIRDGRERRQGTPAAANNFLKTMRALFRWAKEAEHILVDPAKEVSFLTVKTKGFTPWTAEDVFKYRERWELGTSERVALEVILNTGLRRSDAVRLGRQHVKDEVATITLQKTEKTSNVTVHIPILPALQRALQAGPVGDLTFIVGKRGLPMTKESFGNTFRGYCESAGIAKGKSAHGLRKLAATIVAENGGSENELQALFGWVTNTQSLVYTRGADKKRLGLAAAMKLMGDED